MTYYSFVHPQILYNTHASQEETFDDSKKSLRKMILVFLLAISVFLVIFYIREINNLVNLNYQSRIYAEKLRQITGENKNLEIKLAQLRSSGLLEAKIQNLDLIAIDKVDYIVAGTPASVAINQPPLNTY